MHQSSWNRLMLTAGIAILPACGSPALDATEDVGQTAGLALKADKFRKSADAIPGQYIVVLKDSALGTAKVPEIARALAAQHGGTVARTYEHALHGFVVRTSEERARALAARPEVDYVEEDGKVHGFATQSQATWGLDRIDQLNLPLSTTYSYGTTGAGVNVYVIDSGILTSHSEFGGRATGDFTAITTDGYGASDCHGHGTHVAGTVGGATWGVAKNARLHSVRVLDCKNAGAASDVIAGVDWVTAHHVSPAVANMSLGWASPDSQSIDDAVTRSIASGVVYVAAAGNNYIDACAVTPARVPAVITVGASTDSDSVWGSSNWGTCLDLYAPGQDILSASIYGGGRIYSGTSMAAPHVSGVAALYLQSNPGASPATVATAIVANSPANKVTGTFGGGTTRLLYSNPPPACGRLASGQALVPGQTLYSCSGSARLVHQTDGNVVLYSQSGTALWSTTTWNQISSTFVMQTDGNLVLYPDSTSSPLWHTATWGNNGAYLAVQDDCNLVLYNDGGTTRLWQTNSSCR